jgi:F-type H+-transporting ATPase subunit a
MMLARRIAAALGILSISDVAFAAGIPHTINYYDIVAHTLHIDPKWEPTLGALLVLAVVTLMGLYFKASVAKSKDDVIPSGKFSLRFVIEGVMEFLHGLAKDNCGEHFRKYLPFLSALFIFILTANLSGLIPGFPPPTESMDTNVAMGIIVFLVYNIAGLKEHGFGYIKHFLGPVAAIAPIFFCIELVSHGSRPLSLGLRLAGNIYGDHTLLGVFTGLSYIVLPAILMFFGLLVAVVQSFVFTLLTGIYISMAISHDH